jgi:uncharacterized protein (TIGR01244 family)
MSHLERRAAAPVSALLLALSAVGVIAWAGISNAEAQASNQTVTGIVNYTPIDKNLTIGGAVTPDGIAEIKRRGFKTVINLRKSTEANANVEAEGEAVKAAGMKYINLPFSPGDPYETASAQVEPFLKAVGDRSNWPVFVHSAQSHRPAGLLVIRRVLSGWTLEKAYASADAQVLADGSAGAKGIKDFAEKYLKAHGK